MKKKTIRLLFMAIAVTAVWTGCKKDKDLVPVPQPVVNEPEVITTMKLTFVDSSNTSNIKYATFRDPDGDGGGGPDIFDTIKLQHGKTWLTSIQVLNETVSPVEDITPEILDEKNDHLFCFTPSGTSASVVITDVDGNSLPVGLQSKWKTTTNGNGTMQIVLKHQPGIKTGSCSLGDTDIDVTFQVKIQ